MDDEKILERSGKFLKDGKFSPCVMGIYQDQVVGQTELQKMVYLTLWEMVHHVNPEHPYWRLDWFQRLWDYVEILPSTYFQTNVIIPRTREFSEKRMMDDVDFVLSYSTVSPAMKAMKSRFLELLSFAIQDMNAQRGEDGVWRILPFVF